MDKISIIVINYNYEKFLGSAIDSALAVRWPDKEVIVVDDGSTDGSRAIIESYGDRVTAMFKANGGQNSAANVGFEHSTGDIVFFLDSDDALDPEVAERVAAVWHERVSKVQFPLRVLSEKGVQVAVYPQFPANYTPEQVVRGIDTTCFYVSSPTSGNAWARTFLERAFPLPSQWTDEVPAKFFDGYLSTLAPRFGDVLTLQQPLGKYRENPNNFWTTRFSPELVAENCREDTARWWCVNRKLYAMGYQPIFGEHFTHMMKRVVYRRFLPESDPYDEGVFGVLGRAYRSVLIDPAMSMKARVIVALWFTAVMFTPTRKLALPIVKLRYVPTYRPKFVRFVLALLRRK